MKQLSKNLKNGEISFLETPIPSLGEGQILIKNHFSAISAGTEGRTIKDAKASYVQKAKSRPKELMQVIDTAKKIGLSRTYSLVMDKLNSPSKLGYSCAGEVIGLGKGVKNFKVGDFVACGGGAHSEVISVYENLCVKVPKEVSLRDASLTTLGAICTQGIRQSKVQFGEYCCVLGLGLMGQITLQILNAIGVKAIGVDIDDDKVSLAKINGAEIALNRNNEAVENIIHDYTRGNGVDGVIITAASSSNDPVNFSGKISRQKGIVVSVGRVPTDFDRDVYYNKELDLRMSCSYGPGRYDPEYEIKGHDYPIGYVRWTENRNMQSFVDLIVSKKINLKNIITHEFDFFEAEQAFNIITDKKESFLGMILKYNFNDVDLSTSITINNSLVDQVNEISIGMIGAGSFAQKSLLPNIKDNTNLISVATNTSINANHIGNKFSFQNITCNAEEVISNDAVNTVFIATRHNTHADFVLSSLRNNKNIFVEKPLCLNEEELELIKEEYNKRNVHLMVGYNRRFAPQIDIIKDKIGLDTIKTINYRVNVGAISPKHWTQDPEIGGGRILGEVCHFLDLCMYLCNSKPDMISAFKIKDPMELENTLSIILQFKNGSIANINYYANGNEKLSKEYIEVHSNNISATLDDFRKLTIFSNKVIKKNALSDKGHKIEINSFLDALQNGTKTPISFDDIYWSSKMSFDVIKSIRNRETVKY